ncbi:MAG: FAD-dependent 5-carboxymethylaminomethyl-2-thiouridine(34) oxidoreductase MnmC [Burkholderiaceae bacterium]
MACASSLPPWLRAVGLPQAWREQAQWRVLDTAFGTGERFLQLWQAWLQDSDACERLHVVAFTDAAPGWDAWVRTAAPYPAAQACTHALEQQWFGLMPGFHRMVFANGRLRLTLCIGATAALLRQQQWVADSIVIGEPALPDGAAETKLWDAWTLKSLARLCRRGSTLAVMHPTRLDTRLDTRLLVKTGWQPQAMAPAIGLATTIWSGQYQPRWQIKSTRAPWARPPLPAAHCVVIGAGLAGAAVADALAQRGKQVTVVDAANAPSAGASGLPAGLFAAQVSRDDGPRSRLSRAGVRITLLAARRLLQHDLDWALSGLVHIRDTAASALPPDWPAAGAPWASIGSPHGGPLHRDAAPPSDARSPVWHTMAGWIKPAQLVRGWLAHPSVRFVGDSTVHAITLEAGQWRLWSQHGRLLAEAAQVVIACAGNSVALLRMALAATGQAPATMPLPALAATHGQVSWGLHGAADAPAFATVPINGAGSVLAHVPQAEGSAWFCGATYETAAPNPRTEAIAHAHNLTRLAQLAPRAADALAPAFASGSVHAWRGTRWSSPDRLPIVGAWPMDDGAPAAGLWISTAMGSRGLTYAALCGELIAAQMCGEPLPLDAALHAAIDVRRFGAKETRRKEMAKEAAALEAARSG